MDLEKLKNNSSKLKNFDGSFAKSKFSNISIEDLKTCDQIIKSVKNVYKNEGAEAALKYLQKKGNELRNTNG